MYPLTPETLPVVYSTYDSQTCFSMGTKYTLGWLQEAFTTHILLLSEIKHKNNPIAQNSIVDIQSMYCKRGFMKYVGVIPGIG